jgi:hypothetical protein
LIFLGKVLSYIENFDDKQKDYYGKPIEKAVYILVFEEG